jgi:glyoxylase-like metal-dependent hydrolase (beta-lactamase superfamily II)
MQNSKPNSNKFSKLKKIFVVSLIIITILVGVLYYFLLVYNGSSSKEYTIDINQVRKLSDVSVDQLPNMVQYESILKAKTPLALEVSGGDWTNVNDAITSFRVVYPNQKTYIVDTAYDAEINKGNGSKEDIEASSRIQKALADSTGILLTHEHAFHIGNILDSKNSNELLKKSIITTEQYQNQDGINPVKWPQGSRNGYVPLFYEKYHVVAPGIVLIKAPGNTPGAQIVYIKQKNGKEIILLGGVAWRQENIDRQLANPIIVSLLLPEDREATLGQIKALNTLKKSTPTIEFIAGHDADDLAKLDSKGVIFNKFN